MVNNVFDDVAFSEVFKIFVALVLRWHKCMFLGWCERVPFASWCIAVASLQAAHCIEVSAKCDTEC